jgi:hypothetical protein
MRTLDANRHEGRLPEILEEPAHGLLLRELLADLLPELGQRRLALRLDARQLQHDELRHAARRIVDLEWIDDLVRRLAFDRLLIRFGQLRARERIRDAPLLDRIMKLCDE